MSPRSKELSEEMRAKSKAALISTARRLFAQKGYFKCRIADITREAEMSQGIIYWYFSSKEELLKAVLSDGFESLGTLMAEAARGSGTAPEKLDALVDKMIQFSREKGDFNTIMLSLLGHGGNALFDGLGFHMEEIGMGYTVSVAAIIEQGQVEGTISKGADPATLTVFFFGLSNGLNLTYENQWTEIPAEVIKSAVRRLIGVVR
jgi:AcrR family transcriptional regulator